MRLDRHSSRLVVALVAAGAVMTLIVSPSDADSWRRYKGVREERVVVRPTRTVVVHSYDPAPVLAGFIGGVVLGTALSHAPDYDSHVYVHEDPACDDDAVSYYDPWCREDFVSLADYRVHLRYHHHPRVVRVVRVYDGAYVRSLCWHGDAWMDRGDWDDDRHGDDE
jgi:hypothetical protein